MINWQEEINLIKKEGLYREMKTLSWAQDPRIVLEGKEFIMFASNNYLGLANNSEIKNKAIEAIKLYGTGSGGSRLTTGNYDLHECLEDKLALFKGRESGLLFNTGYMANLGVLTTVVGQGDIIFSDQLNHASIIDGCCLSKAEAVVYQHNNIKKLEAALTISGNYRRRLIVTDGVFSMDGDLAPLPQIVKLAKKYEAIVMVDDAHGTGVLGERGAGIVEKFALEEYVDIQVGTLSKALAAEGGFVTGSQELIDLLQNKARTFIYSTALAPGTIATAIASLEYLQQYPEIIIKLRENIEVFKSGLEALGYQLLPSSSAIISIIIGDRNKTIKLSKELFNEGVLVSGIRPPTVPCGTSRIRATVMATHSFEDIQEALFAFAKVGKKLGLVN